MLNRKKAKNFSSIILLRLILGFFVSGILSSCVRGIEDPPTVSTPVSVSKVNVTTPRIIEDPSTVSTPVSVGKVSSQKVEEVNSEAIHAVLNDVSTGCNSNIVTSGSHSTVTCGNLILIIYPPVPGPSKTTIVPVVSFLSRNYKWKLESTTQLEGAGKGLELLNSQLSSPGLQTLMSQSSYLIAIGTASHEGDPDEEARRAKLRSIAIDDVLRRTLPAKNVLKEFYLLNLGKYDNKCVESKIKSTSYQRPVLVMNILIQSEGKILPRSALVSGLNVNAIEKAIRDKVSDEPPADVNLKCYPLFKINP